MLFTNENCRKGMLAYIGAHRDGILPTLAAEIGDEGRYLDEVKSRISAGDANWVWNSATVDEKIDDVILDYEIVRESKPVLGGCSSLKEAIHGWMQKTNQIGISGEILERNTGSLGAFMKRLTELKKSQVCLPSLKVTTTTLSMRRSRSFFRNSGKTSCLRSGRKKPTARTLWRGLTNSKRRSCVCLTGMNALSQRECWESSCPQTPKSRGPGRR